MTRRRVIASVEREGRRPMKRSATRTGLSRTMVGLCAMLVAVLLAAMAPAAHAHVLDAPRGPTILTVTGAVTHPNRGPFDPDSDVLFAYHDRRFDTATAFDRAMLEALPSHEISVAYEGWSQPARFEGPWLKDVLAVAGAAGSRIGFLALDGFASEIAWSDLDDRDWLVALKRDGRPLDLGGYGPLWILYARQGGAVATEADEQRWPWAVFLIDVN